LELSISILRESIRK